VLRVATAEALHRRPERPAIDREVLAESHVIDPEEPTESPTQHGWLTLPRLGWLVGALAACVWQIAVGRAGIALIVLCAVAPVVLLVRRPGPSWLAAALAPALGLFGLAAAFPALAGQADRWRTRALLGALGYWWLRLAEHPLDGLGPGRQLWLGALWALAAALLPLLVRGRSALLDTLAAILWAALLAAAVPLLDRGLHPHGALLGAALGGLLAVAARALRGPVRPV
jgi:hypothetical protein